MPLLSHRKNIFIALSSFLILCYSTLGYSQDQDYVTQDEFKKFLKDFNQVKAYAHVQYHPRTFTVDCASQSINEFISRRYKIRASLTVQISGVCDEEIIIDRDNITIAGISGIAELRAKGENKSVITVNSGARNIIIKNIKLSGGSSAITADERAQVHIDNVQIENSTTAIFSRANSSVKVSNSHLHDNLYTGLYATTGGQIFVHENTVIENNTVGAVSTLNGGLVFTDDGSESGNNYIKVRDNEIGLHLISGGAAELKATEISGSSSAGIYATLGANLVLRKGAHGDKNLFKNNYFGIYLDRNSNVAIQGKDTSAFEYSTEAAIFCDESSFFKGLNSISKNDLINNNNDISALCSQ